MKKKILIVICTVLSLFGLKSQQISMYFPQFAGKSYDLIIFQGSEQKTLIQGVIPSDGKFELSIPKQDIPYTGMSRWLITGTKEGGGLDMFIPGHDFSVSCTEAMPNEKNIVYTNNTGNGELNRLYRYQEGILSRHRAMLLATQSYESFSPHYTLFESELKKQKNDYNIFQKKIRNTPDYISNFLSIVNITQGLGAILTDNEVERGRDIARYISGDLNWNTLYTSGHWSSVIESWVSIHSNVLKDPSGFLKEFKSISARIPSKKLYKDFCAAVSYYLKQYERNDYLEMMVPIESQYS
ncbi:alkyl hydroperoxide reductase [Elizabethkingia meningoseptica]|uniref:alkyl hydroperoxide reductase n=1 Tax=Elizabethkingia meningoseptica TaxID=238 RepID=UPI002DD682A4|nr:alkyl hydroperoxide reductase [Elizabethkingia meningoseptica]MEC4711872.1 alkyl hydroperoxide reductase [Elizabethkingia meningoseptica]